jgi:hypothetical protein
MGQYTIVAQQKAKIIDGKMRPRSKDPPITSCTVQAQNSIWYKQKTISGSSAEPGDQRIAPEHPLEAYTGKFSRYLSTYKEQTYTPMTANDWNNIASADFRRERPEYRKPIPGMMSQTRYAMIIR